MNGSFGSITSFRAGAVDFRFTLDTGRFSASQQTVETGHNRTHAPQQHQGGPFPRSGTETPKQQVVQRDAAQPKAERSTSKKASKPAQSDKKSEQQLYQEFLEWKSRQKDQR
jgi:hypothetical protein